jgi:hypothetical protein
MEQPAIRPEVFRLEVSEAELKSGHGTGGKAPKPWRVRMLSADEGPEDAEPGDRELPAAPGLIMRVEALVESGWKRPGAGFPVLAWGSLLVTARHVVMGAGGARPAKIRILGRSGGAAVWLQGVNVAYYPPSVDPDADVAVVQLNMPVAGAFEPVTPTSLAKVAVRGYSPAESFLTEAALESALLRLRRAGFPGMSGGPVLLAPDDGSAPRHVIGVYVGSREGRGVAHPIDHPVLLACRDALLGAT